MGLDASGLGNLELTEGLDSFAKMLAAANFPFVTVDLDFSHVPDIEIGPDAGLCSQAKGQVVKSCYIDTEIGKVGLTGRAAENLFVIVEDAETSLAGLDYVGGRDPETNLPLKETTKMVRAQIEALEKQGIDIIIYFDQSFDVYTQFSEGFLHDDLTGIDIIVAENTGQDQFFALSAGFGPFNLLRTGDSPTASYPEVKKDIVDHQVLIVNGANLYR
jgi:2',3'-cyclic-nucleotide 2'-phosphodiesterase (5'-nucleotidase family)